MSHWSSLKEKSCGYWQMQLLLKIYKLCGKLTLKLCLYPIVFVFLLFSRQTRIFSYQYLSRIYKIKNRENKNSFPAITYTSIFKHIFSFADALADKVAAWSGDLPLERVVIQTNDAYETFLNHLENKRGVFLVSSHFGNIEVFRALGNLNYDKRLKTDLKINTIMQLQHTAHFNKLMRQLNPNVTTNLISATDVGIDTVISLKDKLSEGEVVITAGDRTAARNQDKNISIKFLEEEASFPLGAFTLASLMDSPIYFVFLLKDNDIPLASKELGKKTSDFTQLFRCKGDRYNLYMYKSSVDFQGSRKERNSKINDIAKEYAGRLENLLLIYPYQWYNFFDFWKK